MHSPTVLERQYPHIEKASERHRSVWRTYHVLLSIVALVCSTLELELIEKIDGILQYMTLSEAALDLGVALLFLISVSAFWWLSVLLLSRLATKVKGNEERHYAIFCRLALVPPLSYFVLTFVNAVRLRFYPHWHPAVHGWMWIGPSLVLACTAAVCVPRLSRLGQFCRFRLVPIGWLHIGLAAVAVIGLWRHHASLFHDYATAGRTVSASNLPDIYLITIDALRADDMSLYGYSRPTTPNLRRFSERSYTFEYFFSDSNFTTSATTSIETGKRPWTHRVFQLGGFLRGQQRKENLAALLHERGYYTATIASNHYASPVSHGTLDSYDAAELPQVEGLPSLWGRYTNLKGLNTLHTLSGPLLAAFTGVRSYLIDLLWSDRYLNPASLVFDRARELAERKDINQPRFIWLHILPPHDPYLPPPPFQGRFLPSKKLSHLYDFIGLQNDQSPSGISTDELRARYDECIAYSDQAVGEFIDWLDQKGRLDQSIVIVTADHGESFEHNWLMHTGPYLYNGLIRVPFMVHLPGQQKAYRIGEVGEQVDILPTVLNLIGSKLPNWAEGISLLPVMTGSEKPTRPILSMNLENDSIFRPITDGTVSIADDNFKYILRLGTSEAALYRYRDDPLEQTNLLSSEPAVAATMNGLLKQKLNAANAKVARQPF